MDKLKNYILKNEWIDILILICISIIFSMLFSTHWYTTMSDRGREFLFPMEILNGNVPYKDITVIYFPFAFYINAVIYKILGVSFYSLICSQTIVCSIAILAYHKIAKLFLSRSTAFILALLILASCIYSSVDLFSYIVPYSWSRVYGIFGYWGCIYALVNLLKKDKIKYAYLAAIFSGFAISCKLEFLSVAALLVVGLFLYKKLNYRQYLKIFAMLLLFPIIEICILFIQKVSFQDIMGAIKFGVNFSKTPAMTNFLTLNGFYPTNLLTTFRNFIIETIPIFLSILFICYLSLQGKSKFKTFLFIPLGILTSTYFYFNQYQIQFYWRIIPIAILLIFLINFKNLLKTDKALLILILGALLISQREFFSVVLYSYGTYSLPFLLLCLIIFTKKYLPSTLGKIEIKNITNMFLATLIIFYCYGNIIARNEQSTPIITNKGTIYTTKDYGALLNRTITYIEKNISKDDTILVLPEGNLINYITGRKVDLHCFMMDRLYFDGYGETEATKKIINTHSDYIILVEGLNTGNFENEYIYRKGYNKAGNYIAKNYTLEKRLVGDGINEVRILKKKIKQKK